LFLSLFLQVFPLAKWLQLPTHLWVRTLWDPPFTTPTKMRIKPLLL
jgi:hypothetical protein